MVLVLGKYTVQYFNALLCSVTFYCLFSFLLGLPDLLLGLIFALLGSQVPALVPFKVKYSLFWYGVFFVGLLVYPLIFVPVAIGFTASLFIALLSKRGCMLLYPVRSTTFTGPANYLESGGKDEKAATAFLLVFAILAVAFSLCGSVIISEINDNQGLTNYVSNRVDSGSWYGSSGSSGGSARYGENNSGYVHYVYIDPGTVGDKNITSSNYFSDGENRTTTIITEYTPPVENETS